jgi:hypothetical protein
MTGSVRDLLVALSAGKVDWSSMLPDAWIGAHPELKKRTGLDYVRIEPRPKPCPLFLFFLFRGRERVTAPCR